MRRKDNIVGLQRQGFINGLVVVPPLDGKELEGPNTSVSTTAFSDQDMQRFDVVSTRIRSIFYEQNSRMLGVLSMTGRLTVYKNAAPDLIPGLVQAKRPGYHFEAVVRSELGRPLSILSIKRLRFELATWKSTKTAG